MRGGSKLLKLKTSRILQCEMQEITKQARWAILNYSKSELSVDWKKILSSHWRSKITFFLTRIPSEGSNQRITSVIKRKDISLRKMLDFMFPWRTEKNGHSLVGKFSQIWLIYQILPFILILSKCLFSWNKFTNNEVNTLHEMDYYWLCSSWCYLYDEIESRFLWPSVEANGWFKQALLF